MAGLRRLLILAFAGLPPAAGAALETGVAAGWTRVTHEERDAGGGRLVRESGDLPTLRLHATWRDAQRHLGVSLQGTAGDLGYDGRTQGGAALAAMAGTERVALRLEAGQALPGLPALRVVAGLEAREWRRHVEAGGGVSLVHRDTWALAGLQATLSARPDWRLTLQAEVQHALAASVRVHYTGLYDPARLSPGTGQAARVAMGLESAPGQGFFWRLEPWLRVQRQARSADGVLTRDGFRVGSLHEPASRGREAGLMLQAGWRF